LAMRALLVALLAAHAAGLQPTTAATGAPIGALRQLRSPAVTMLAKSKRRQARKAKKDGVQPPAPELPLQSPAVPPPSAETAMAPPTFDAPLEIPTSADGLQDLRGAFVQDTTQIANVLPSFDDFRRRDALDADEAVEEGRRVRERASAPAPPLSPAEQVRERAMNLLAFDNIDDRPVNEDPYDLTAKLLGRGLPSKAGAYINPYIQIGHLLLLVTLLLSTLISYPGFPLTEVPDEYRALLFQGLAITYTINAGAAIYARGIAAAKEEPVGFWQAKVFLLGGIALGELVQAVPEPETRFPNQRKRR